MSDILVIPDTHVYKEHDDRRFHWLVKLIADRRPATIVHIGDFADVPSLCSYDKGKQSAEGRRYMDDVEYTHKALDIIKKGLESINTGKVYKKYYPRLVLTLGNHEHRITRAAQESPELFGFISLEDLQYDEHGWEVYPFMEPVEVQGVAFAHYFPSGVMCKPIGGKHAAATVVSKNFQSSIWGHSHLYKYYEDVSVMGRKIQAINVGCFLDPDYHASYAGQANKMWRNGLTYLTNVDQGSFDHEFISTERLQKEYS